jgi:hypothetical protein
MFVASNLFILLKRSPKSLLNICCVMVNIDRQVLWLCFFLAKKLYLRGITSVIDIKIELVFTNFSYRTIFIQNVVHHSGCSFDT